MSEFALLDTDNNLLRIETHAAQPPDPVGKGWKWRPVSRVEGDGGSHFTEGVWVVETPAATAVVPDVVNRWNALEALLTVPITADEILAQINLISDDIDKARAKILFDRPTWARNSAVLATMAEAFELSESEIDDLFIAAAAM